MRRLVAGGVVRARARDRGHVPCGAWRRPPAGSVGRAGSWATAAGGQRFVTVARGRSPWRLGSTAHISRQRRHCRAMPGGLLLRPRSLCGTVMCCTALCCTLLLGVALLAVSVLQLRRCVLLRPAGRFYLPCCCPASLHRTPPRCRYPSCAAAADAGATRHRAPQRPPAPCRQRSIRRSRPLAQPRPRLAAPTGQRGSRTARPPCAAAHFVQLAA
jgi:hypothetical protein